MLEESNCLPVKPHKTDSFNSMGCVHSREKRKKGMITMHLHSSSPQSRLTGPITGRKEEKAGE